MEVLNFNDGIRRIPLEYIDKYCLNGLTLDEAVDRFRDNLYDLENSFDVNKIAIREHIIKILYLDAIKMALYIHKTGIVNDEEAIFLCDLKEINSEEDLLAEVSCNPYLFSKIIKYAYKYIEIDNLSKKLIVKSLSPIENDWLTKLISYHFFDVLQYSTSITLEEVVEELKSNKKYQEKNFVQDLSDSNALRIMGVIQALSLYDRNGYYNLLLDIAKTDYGVCKYLNKQIDDCPMIDDHIDFYENYPINDILFNLTTNQMFLKSSIWMVISYYIDKQYDEIPLPDDIIEKEVSKKMIKKLTLE